LSSASLKFSFSVGLFGVEESEERVVKKDDKSSILLSQSFLLL